MTNDGLPYLRHPHGGLHSYDQDCLLITSPDAPATSRYSIVGRKPWDGVSSEDVHEYELRTILHKFEGDFHRARCRHSVIELHKERFQRDKNYLLEEIEIFLKQCTKPGATLWYCGASEIFTGNWWCHGLGSPIDFSDILQIYLRSFQPKILTIVSDCPYSGNWVLEFARALDKEGIPACGHKLREKNYLIKVYTSCRSYQVARAGWFATHGVQLGQDNMLGFGCTSIEGQSPLAKDFSSILTCLMDVDDIAKCKARPWCKWVERIKARTYLVRGTDKNRPAWHYVLVYESKVSSFLAKVEGGHVDVAKYGIVIDSGWGKDPPNPRKHLIDSRFA